MRALLFASLFAAAGCVRAPAPVDVNALIAKRGPEEARRDLAIRVLDDPRDVQARLALAAVADQIGRPSEAIEQLEAVQNLGGPIGTRWHAHDRARLARLLLARGRARIARGAPAALADLERAAALGGTPSPDELVSAKIAVASAHVRHVDGAIRAKGRAIFAALAKPRAGSSRAPSNSGGSGSGSAANSSGSGSGSGDGMISEETAWLGARDGASPHERGAFGAWLWTIGARREAFDNLRAWHDATPTPRDEGLQSAYLRAYAWWVPLWLGEAQGPPAEDLVGPERCQFPGSDCAPSSPSSSELDADASPLPPLPPLSDLDRAEADLGLTGSRLATLAAARYATTRTITLAGDTEQLVAIARAHDRDPSIADRLGIELVARSTDAAVGHAQLGALFDALGDRPRARAAWHAAVALSDEAPFLRGLAEAIGRAGDGPAAIVYGTSAGAASGDPAVVWNAVGAALLGAKQYVDALTAQRSAVELAGPDALPRALDLAIEINRALGRTAQADALALQRAQAAIALSPRGATPALDAMAALVAHRARPTAVTTARLWVVSRTHPRDVEARAALLADLDSDDARRPVVVRELLELAGDESSERALVAVHALRLL